MSSDGTARKRIFQSHIWFATNGSPLTKMTPAFLVDAA